MVSKEKISSQSPLKYSSAFCQVLTVFPLVWINYLYFFVSSATLDTYVPIMLLLRFQNTVCCFHPQSFAKAFLKTLNIYFLVFAWFGDFLAFWVCGFLKTFTISLDFEFSAPSE